MHYLRVALFIGISLLVHSENIDLIEEAALLVNKVYVKHRLTAVVWWNCDQDYITGFLRKFNGTAITVAIKEDFDLNNTDFHKALQYKQTVFFADSAAEFEYFLKMLKSAIIVSIRVILIITNRNLDTFIEFTKIAWNEDVSDIILMGYHADGTIGVQSYNPYGSDTCGNYTPVNVNNNTRNYFPMKFRNFYGCPINVTVLEYLPYVKLTQENETITAVGGVDGNLIKIVIQALNASMNIVSAPNRTGISYLVNGKYNGTYSDIVYGIADVMVPSLIMKPVRYNLTQISYSYKVVNIVWCFPKPREIYPWARLFLPFLNYSTPIIVFVFLTIIAILKISEKFRRTKEKSTKGIGFAMFGMFIGQEVKIYTRYWFVNSIFTFWVWFCFIVRISYQGNLIEGLQHVILESPVRTLSEAEKVADEIGGVNSFLTFYKNTSIGSKYKSVKVTELLNYMRNIGAGKRILFAIDLLQVIYYRQRVQILEERVTNIPSCIYMRPRWSGAPEVSRVVKLLMEGGFVNKLWNDFIHVWFIQIGYAGKTHTVSLEPLRLKILSACFYGLILMYFICLFVFILEIILGRRRMKLKRLRKLTFRST